MRLENRTAIITGAGGGIGRACALAFAREGANLVLVDLFGEAAEKAGELAAAAGARVVCRAADICSEADVEAFTDAAIREFGSIDSLVNLAGSQGPGAPVWEVSATEWKRCAEINLFGTFLVCSRVIRHMVHARYGRIVNVASGAGRHPMSFFSAYSASKAGVIHFTRTIAEELKDYGITANAAGVRGITRMWQDVLNAEAGGGTTENVRAMIRDGFNPLPEENAPVLVFLSSEESGHVTGQYLEANALPGCIVSKG